MYSLICVKDIFNFRFSVRLVNFIAYAPSWAILQIKLKYNSRSVVHILTALLFTQLLELLPFQDITTVRPSELQNGGKKVSVPVLRVFQI